MLYLLFLQEGGGGSCLVRLCFPAAFKLFVYLLELQLHHLIRHNVDPTSHLTKCNQIESYLHYWWAVRLRCSGPWLHACCQGDL